MARTQKDSEGVRKIKEVMANPPAWPEGTVFRIQCSRCGTWTQMADAEHCPHCGRAVSMYVLPSDQKKGEDNGAR